MHYPSGQVWAIILPFLWSCLSGIHIAGHTTHYLSRQTIFHCVTQADQQQMFAQVHPDG